MTVERVHGAPATLEELLGEIEELPTLPLVVSKINSMTSNPQTNAADIGKVIGNDPALSSKILKLVNSAYYGFPRRINSVTKAIVLLGFNKVKNVALSAAVVDSLRRTTDLGGFSFYGFWEHSVTTGIAAEATSRALYPQLVDDAFVSGLFHDLGRVVLVNFMPEWPQVFARAATDNTTLADACRAELGFDHAYIGSLLAEHWNFPEVLVESIRNWTTPDRSSRHREIIACVHIANAAASGLGMPAPGDCDLPMLNDKICAEVRLDSAILEKICRETLSGFDNAAAFLELAKSGNS